MLRLTSFLAVVLVGVGQVEGADLYSVTDLDDLPGGENASEAFAINNGGQVVGIGSVAGARHAFLYSNGVMTDIGVVWDDQHSSIAYDINDLGYVVGHSFGDNHDNRSYLYNNGSVTDLNTLGGAYANAGSINNSNEVVGMSIYANGVTHAFRWSNDTMIDLDHPSSSSTSYAYGINDLGQIVGTMVPFGSQGFLWENGQLTDLSDLVGGSGHTTPFAINNQGQVVGYSGSLGPTTSQPFIWENGVMEDLGSLPGRTDWGYARGINDFGEVVGSSGGHAFAWDSVSGIRDLNDLLDNSGTDWELTHAYDINDSGIIVGMGTNPDGFSHGVLLTPIPEPSTFVLLTISIVSLLACRWRRRHK